MIQNSWNQLLQVNDWQEAVLLWALNCQPPSNRPKQTSQDETTRAYGRGKRQPCPSGNTNHNWRFEPSVRQRTPPSLPTFTGPSDHYKRRPPGLMGGASANHASPITSQDSNLLSDYATQLCPDHQHHHLSPPPTLPFSNTGTGMQISPLHPKDSDLSPVNAIQPVPKQAKDLTPHPTPLPFQLQAQLNVTLTPYPL